MILTMIATMRILIRSFTLFNKKKAGYPVTMELNSFPTRIHNDFLDVTWHHTSMPNDSLYAVKMDIEAIIIRHNLAIAALSALGDFQRLWGKWADRDWSSRMDYMRYHARLAKTHPFKDRLMELLPLANFGGGYPGKGYHFMTPIQGYFDLDQKRGFSILWIKNEDYSIECAMKLLPVFQELHAITKDL